MPEKSHQLRPTSSDEQTTNALSAIARKDSRCDAAFDPPVDNSETSADAADVTVLFEDEFLIAVAKPAGLFVHRSREDRSVSEALLQQVRDQIGQHLFTVHRLDRATSGLVLLAKTTDVAADLGRQFAERKIRKTYRALVRGFTEDFGRIDDPLVAARGRGLPADHPHAKPQNARTDYQTVQRFELPLPDRSFTTTRVSLVDVFPRTGRFHQIRRHFNYISHPVIGDSSHGDHRTNRRLAEFCGQQRLLLAATELRLIHPASQQRLQINCPLENSFITSMSQLTPFCCRDSIVLNPYLETET